MQVSNLYTIKYEIYVQNIILELLTIIIDSFISQFFFLFIF